MTTPAGHSPLPHSPATGARRPPVAAVVTVLVVVVLALGFAGFRLLGTLTRQPELRASADVTLTPDGDGTRVAVRLQVSGAGAFPGRVQVTLPAQDDGVSTDGTVFTGTTLRYSEVADGSGAAVTPSADPNPRLELAGGGPRLELGYRVAATAGRTVVLPVPGVKGVQVVLLRVHGSGALDPSGLRCWQGGGSDNGQLSYHPCTLDGTGSLLLTEGSQIRLEP